MSASMEKIEEIYRFEISPAADPVRVDTFLSNQVKHATRTKVQKAIEAGLVKVNGECVKASRKITPGDIVTCTVYKSPPLALEPQPIPLDIVYEDQYLIVVNKAPGMVVHPAYKHREGTLVNAMLYHLGQRETVDLNVDDDDPDNAVYASSAIRPGIVHRLDKDTSGLIIVGKNETISQQLSSEFQQRRVAKRYRALVWGDVVDSTDIHGAIGRSKKHRMLREVVRRGGKEAHTTIHPLERLGFATLLDVELHTGRTHQIRVHCSHKGHPLVGDTMYPGHGIPRRPNLPAFKKFAERVAASLGRQALHAQALRFQHPVTKSWIELDSELPQDIETALATLREYHEQS